MTIEDIARICHEANRAYCETMEDGSQVPWDEAPGWQRTSAMNGVDLHLANRHLPASASHESWMDEKVRDGWVYGEVKDAELKTHPCIVPFEELPPEQQAKDHCFKAIVSAFRDFVD